MRPRLTRLPGPSLAACLALAVCAGSCTSAREGDGPSQLGPNKPLPGQPIPPAPDTNRDAAPPPEGGAPMPGFNPPPMPMPMMPTPMPTPTQPSACTDEQLTCNDTKRCTTRVFGFEADLGGWNTRSGNVTNAVAGDLALSEAQAHGGTKAMAARLELRPYRGLLTLHQSFCGHSVTNTPPFPSVNLRGKSASAWVYLERASGEGGIGRCFFLGFTADDFPRELGVGKPWTVIEEGAWTEIRTLFDEVYADKVTDIQFECQLRATTDLYTGTLYVDDVRVE